MNNKEHNIQKVFDGALRTFSMEGQNNDSKKNKEIELVKRELTRLKNKVQEIEAEREQEKEINKKLFSIILYLLFKNPNEELSRAQIDRVLFELMKFLSINECRQYLESLGFQIVLNEEIREKWKKDIKLGVLSSKDREEDIKKYVMKKKKVTREELCERYNIKKKRILEIMKKISNENEGYKLISQPISVPHKRGNQVREGFVLTYTSN